VGPSGPQGPIGSPGTKGTDGIPGVCGYNNKIIDYKMIKVLLAYKLL